MNKFLENYGWTMLGIVMGVAILFIGGLLTMPESRPSDFAVEATLTLPDYRDQVAILDTGLTYAECLGVTHEERKRWGSNVQFRCISIPNT